MTSPVLDSAERPRLADGASLPGRSLGWDHFATAILLAAVAWMALARIDNFHVGDMGALLRFTRDLLAWPPFAAYHNHVTDPWIFNHLPVFPIVLAPLAWLFENVLDLNPAWAAKLLIGLADMAITVILVRQAPARWKVWGVVTAAAWVFAPWTVGEDHPILVALLFVLLALETRGRPWLSGLMLGFGVGTRSEAIFLAAPLVFHFLSKRGIRRSVAFLTSFTAILAFLVLPFLLYDADALDYALRRQLQRDASDMLSMVSYFLYPNISLPTAALIQNNPSLLALAVNLLVSLLALRDRRVSRVILAAAAAYLLTLPMMNGRYMLFTYGIGLYFASRYMNPLIVLAVILMPAWEFNMQAQAMIGLAGVLALWSLLRPGEDRPTGQWAFASEAGAVLRGAAAREWTALAGPALLAVVGLAGILIAFRTTDLSRIVFVQDRFVNVLTLARQGKLGLEAPAGADPSAYVQRKSFTIQGDTREVLYMHPTSSAVVRVWVPPKARLRFGMGLDPEVWDKPGDGVDFEVEVRDGDKVERVFSAYLDPKHEPSQRRWVESSVDLSRYAKREVEVVLRTRPHDSPDFDWAGWSLPVIWH